MHALILAGTVVFSGIIMHYQTKDSPREKRAVLVDLTDLEHEPTLQMSNRAHVSHDSGGGSPWKIKPRKDDDDPWIFELKGERLRIIGPSGGVTLGDDFHKHVMKITEIVDGLPEDEEVLEEVEKGNAHANGKTIAFIDYTGGILNMRGCFSLVIEFDPRVEERDPRCLARAVQLRFPTGKRWEIQDADNAKRKIVIKSNGTVFVDNASRQPGFHYKEYSRLLKRQTKLRNMKPTDMEANESGEISLRKDSQLWPVKTKVLGPTVECSNSNYP